MEKNILYELFARSDKEGFAVPAFNYSDIWDFMAIVEAAEEEHAPVMISSNPLVIDAFSPEMCGAIGVTGAGKAKTTIIPHLDHCFKEDMCKKAIDSGFKSVMIDGSKYDLDENVALTKRVVEYAHERGVFVEGEIGKIRGKGIEGDFAGGDYLVNVAEAAEFVQRSGVDSLAVGIGNAHGFYKGKPEINFERLRQVNEAVDIPLVLHGGTGIPEEDIRMAIRNGINKINVGTIIHCTYMNHLREELNRVGENPYTIDVMQPVKEKIKKVVKGWIRVCMADGKA